MKELIERVAGLKDAANLAEVFGPAEDQTAAWVLVED